MSMKEKWGDPVYGYLKLWETIKFILVYWAPHLLTLLLIVSLIYYFAERSTRR